MKIKKLRPLLLLVMVFALACGSMTIRIDTEVVDDDEVTHDLQFQASGQIVELITEDWDPNELREECESSFDSEMFEITCNGIADTEVGLGALEESDDGLSVEVTKTEMESYWEYRISMPNSTYGSEEEIEDNPFAEGLDMDAILKYRLYWSVKMPGEITESNADTFEGREASFTVKLDDDRETLFVVSRQNKSSGFLGGCNARDISP